MEHVRWSSRPTLRTPVLIAAFTGWNDAGDAASGAVRHLIEAWRAEPVATLDPEEFYDFGTTRPLVHLAEGVTREIVWPPNDLWAASTPGADVLLLLGTEPQLKWRTFCRQITAIAAQQEATLVAHVGRAAGRRGPLAPGVAHRHRHRPGPHRPVPPGPVALRGTDGHRRGPPRRLRRGRPAVGVAVGGRAGLRARASTRPRRRSLSSSGRPPSSARPCRCAPSKRAVADYEDEVAELVAADDDLAGYVGRLETMTDVEDDDEEEDESTSRRPTPRSSSSWRTSSASCATRAGTDGRGRGHLPVVGDAASWCWPSTTASASPSTPT